MASRQQRTELTVEDKLEIIKCLKNKKCSLKDLQERYNVTKNTINRIMSREDELKRTRNCKLRRIRSGTHRLVDEAVSKWYRSMKEQNIFVNGPLLRQQAVRFARMMNNHTFEANNGWLWRWQQKENVKFNSSYSGRKVTAKATQSSVKTVRDINEFAESPSLQSVGDANKNVQWQSLSDHMEEGGISHFEIQVKEEVDDLQKNPFETDIVFDIESDEQGCYDNEASQNNYPPQCLNVYTEEIKNYQDEVSVDHGSFQDSNLYHQPVEIKDDQNDHRTNDSEDESEKYRSTKKSKPINEKDKAQDIYSIYGDYIARRLRASANERENYEIYIAQHNIDEIIFKLSMGSYARATQSRTSENYRPENNIQQISQSDQIRQNQPHESIIKEKQTFSSISNSKGKSNDIRSEINTFS